MRSGVRRGVAALVLVGASAHLAAQAADPQPVFRAGVDLVRLDVQVTGANGRPVGDLQTQEVEVLEDGQRRPVLLFQHIAAPAASLRETRARTAASEVSTNHGAPRGQLYVLVFDQHHITTGNEQRARHAAGRFLRTRVQPGDRVAVYALPGPGPQVDFTADVERAVAELVKVRGSLDRFAYGVFGPMRTYEAYAITRGDARMLDRVAARLSSGSGGIDVLGRAGSTAPGAGSGTPMFESLVQEDARTLVAKADQQARNFLLLLTHLVRGLRGIEGRKTVLLFSEGFFTDNVTRELEQVAAASAQSYSVVHALDLNPRLPDMTEEQPSGGDRFREIQSRLEPLGSLATETAGQLFPDASSDLDRSLDVVAAASRDYYVVGFEPPASARRDRDGYRRITVRVNRPGVRVSTRTGYSMVPAPSPADRRRTIDTALVAPFPQQGVRCEYTTYAFRGTTPGSHRVVLSLAAHLPIAGPQPARADVVFVVRDARTGKVAASGTDVIPLPERASAGTTTGIGAYRVQFELPPGTYLMRAVVREPGGAVGSADRQFEVPSLDAPGVSVSDLALSAGADALPARAVAHAGDTLAAMLEVYGRTPEQLRDLDVRLTVSGEGAGEARSAVGQSDEVSVGPAGGAGRTFRVHVPLEGLPPGIYRAQAAVVTAGGERIELTRTVTVLAGARPPQPERTSTLSHPRDVLDGAPARAYALRICAAAAVRGACEAVRSGRWDTLTGLLPAEPDDDPARVGLRGLALFARADYAGAAAALARAHAQDPRSAGVAFLLGWAYAANGRDREAIAPWRMAALVDPRLTPAHLALADAYLRLEQPALAAQVLRAALAVQPDSPELQEKLSRVERR